MIDHYRLGGELLLAGLFTVLLLAFAGRTGLRAVLSFVLTVLMIWKILIPFISEEPIRCGSAWALRF